MTPVGYFFHTNNGAEIISMDNDKQVAALLIFPPGYTMENVREALKAIPQTVSITTKEFNPDHGGVCIYQP